MDLVWASMNTDLKLSFSEPILAELSSLIKVLTFLCGLNMSKIFTRVSKISGLQRFYPYLCPQENGTEPKKISRLETYVCFCINVESKINIDLLESLPSTQQLTDLLEQRVLCTREKRAEKPEK